MKILSATNKSPLISIVLPTFNESGNVADLLERIDVVMSTHEGAYECVFVDDSTDDTSAVICRIAMMYPGRVTLVKRQGAEAKSGLTKAFQCGFEHARGEIIVCMDTDLQHPPEKIPELIQTLQNSVADVAVCSRYIKGGSAEGLDGLFRHFVSRSSMYVVWLLLPATRLTSDPMTGFFAFKRLSLPSLSFHSSGFKILVELLVALPKARVLDIPFTFQKRAIDQSKASMAQGVRFYVDLIRMFFVSDAGSPTIRILFTAGSFSLLTVALMVSLPFVQTIQSSADVPFLVILCVSLATILIFYWGLRSYGYQSIRFSDLSLLTLFAFLVSILFLFLARDVVGFTSFSSDALTLFASFLFVYLVMKPVWHSRSFDLSLIDRIFILLFGAFFFIIFNYFLNFDSLWINVLFFLYLLLIVQGMFALFLTLYIWQSGEDRNFHAHRELFSKPKHSFTAIIPCKHEQATIADTLRAMVRFNYPAHLKQILVVIHRDSDDGTIDVVNKTIQSLPQGSVQLVTYNEEPVNKPHGLNEALKYATGDFVAVFDAEDEPHRDLFNLVNTYLKHEEVDVVQTGVQLMNYDGGWYSMFNVLEYYFWFKSTLHFFAKHGVIPLGGVSVFFRRTMLQYVGGWSETCLTEDADVGIRLSQVGARIAVVYDAEYATQEETPPSVWSFIKQRTRWAQGFMQILFRGEFLRFPTYKQRLLAVYILSWPIMLPILFLFFPLGILLMFTAVLPLSISLLSNVLLLIIILFIVVQIVGFYEFTKDYGIRFPWLRLPILVFLFYPYTILLAIASLRAIYRTVMQVTTWEKTEHLNRHRAKAEMTMSEEVSLNRS